MATSSRTTLHIDWKNDSICSTYYGLCFDHNLTGVSGHLWIWMSKDFWKGQMASLQSYQCKVHCTREGRSLSHIPGDYQHWILSISYWIIQLVSHTARMEIDMLPSFTLFYLLNFSNLLSCQGDDRTLKDLNKHVVITAFRCLSPFIPPCRFQFLPVISSGNGN